LTIIHTRGPTYSIVEVDLSVAHDRYELYCPGDRITVIECTGELDVSLDEPDAPIIELDKVTRLSTVPLKFLYLYFTNPAQPGKAARLYVGREASFESFPLRLGAIGLLDAADARINPAREDGNLADLRTSLGMPSTPVEDADLQPTWTVRRLLDYIRDYAYELRHRGLIIPQYFVYTTTPLAAGATYTSWWADWGDCGFSFVVAMAYSDVPPATDGFRVQFSDDGATVHDEKTASATGTMVARMRGRYQRVRYTNGATAQTVFSLSRRMAMA